MTIPDDYLDTLSEEEVGDWLDGELNVFNCMDEEDDREDPFKSITD